MTVSRADMLGLILCGGAGARVGGADKPLLRWRGQRILDHVVDRLRPQVHSLLISANRNVPEYERYAPVIEDRWRDYQGPLAGIASTLLYHRDHPDHREQRATGPQRYLVCPGDMPQLPSNLAQRLAAEYQLGQPRYVHDGRRPQPLCLLCDDSVLPNLLAYVRSGQRSAKGWLAQCDAQPVSMPDPEAFRNLNSAAELDGSG